MAMVRPGRVAMVPAGMEIHGARTRHRAVDSQTPFISMSPRRQLTRPASLLQPVEYEFNRPGKSSSIQRGPRPPIK